ncbi:MAG: ABC transporter permease, partial [Oscillospiraceae bacterium]|nr:ABC transporter permease [Oscillospiraceae bacterium]
MKALSTEFQKIRHHKVWLVVAAILFVQLLWEFWAFHGSTNRDLSQGWLYCLYQFPLLNSIMMPVVAAVVASRLCDVEHKGNTFKLLETVIPSGKLFDSKFVCGATYLILASLIQVIMIILLGKLKNFTGDLPYALLGLYFLFTSAVNLAILLLQQVLSLLFVNQMAALSVGLLGGLCGLFIMFFPTWLEKLVLWGYYGV